MRSNLVNSDIPPASATKLNNANCARRALLLSIIETHLVLRTYFASHLAMSRAETVKLEAVSACGQQAARQCHGEGIKLALSQTPRAQETLAAPVYHLQRIIGERRAGGYV